MAGLLFCVLVASAWPHTSLAQNHDQDSPPLAYTQALQALQAADTQRAAQLLQQVIAQHPQWAGAWLDLALLALNQGEYAQAEEFLLALEQRFAPLPLAIAQAIERLRSQIKIHYPSHNTPAANPKQKQTMVALATGYETNANSGLQFSTLTLNLPDGDAIVNIDPSSRAKSAHSIRAAWAHYGQQPLGQGSLSWQIQTQARQYTLSNLNNIELLAQTTLTQPQLPGRMVLGWQSIWLGGRHAYQTPIIRWQFDASLGERCGWQQHIQTESRQHTLANHLDTRWQAYRSTWRCQQGQHRSQILAQAARETASTPNRPGGNSQHRLWGLQHEWLKPFGMTNHNLLVRVDMLNSQDSTTYSPLLDKGRARSLQRTDTWINWTAPLPGQAPWRWTMGLQKTLQNSNIEFFKQENYSLETSIWRAW